MTLVLRAALFSWVVIVSSVAADPNGTTALHRATYEDKTGEAIRLIGEGSDVDARNRFGVTVLSLACRNGNAQIVEALLAAGADPNVALKGGESPLMTASRVGRIEVVVALIKAGAHVKATERSGQTALMWAASEGHLKVCELLIESGADATRTLKSGFSPMLFAARNGRTEVVRFLLKQGVDFHTAVEAGRPGGRSPRTGTTALSIAVENGHFETAVALLEFGADPNDQRTGFAILHILTWVRKPNRGDSAAGMPPPRIKGKWTSLDFARALVEDFGADVNLRLKRGGAGSSKFGTKGASPFLLAAQRADLAYLKTLLALGADPVMTNEDGATPLLAVSGVGSRAPEEEAGTESEALEVVAWLLKMGNEVNSVTTTGETAMHGAAYRNWPEMVDWFNENGADVELWNRKNKFGWTPLLIAQGFRPGNFKPSAATVEAIKKVMRDKGVEVPPDPPIPTTEKPKKYEQ